jgi:hypothetical protein
MRPAAKSRKIVQSVAAVQRTSVRVRNASEFRLERGRAVMVLCLIGNRVIEEVSSGPPEQS